jgi:tetratricopeptide (TPR) repeat protein
MAFHVGKPARAAAGVAALAALLVFSSGCSKLKARDNLNKGVEAFKAARYPEAVDHFKTATDLDPNFPTARLYLAMAYMSQWIPGADSPENNRYAQSALDQFNKVLDSKPDNESAKIATASIASIYFNEKNFEKAVDWNKRAISLDPNAKEAYYTLGVIAWTQWITPDREARQKMGIKPDDPGPLKDKKVRDALKVKWEPILNEGIQDEEKAIQIDPQYEDAMAYMNLLIRYKADLADSPEQYQKEIEQANNWMQKSLDTRKIKAEKKAADEAKGIKPKAQ